MQYIGETKDAWDHKMMLATNGWTDMRGWLGSCVVINDGHHVHASECVGEGDWPFMEGG